MYRFEQFIDSEIEYGLRALIIVSVMDKCNLSFEKILIFDYMMTNINDFDNTMESVHPKTSYRFAKLVVKRQMYKDGINYCISKNLIDVDYTSNGIIFGNTSLTSQFLEYLEMPYVQKLIDCATRLNELYSSMTLEELQDMVNNKFEEQGIEFRAVEG